MKKYPLTWMFIIITFNIISGITSWRYVEFFSSNRDGWQSIFFPIFIGGGCILWVAIMLISLTKTRLGKKLGKIWNIEQKNRDRAFRNKLKSGKEIVLVVKRRVFANLSFIFGIILVWVTLLLIPNLSFSELIVILPISVAWTIYGFIFSFFFHKKLIAFQNGKFLLNHDNGTVFVNVDDIKNTRFIKNSKFKDVHPSQTLSVLMLSDIEIELNNGQKLIFEKADKSISFGRKVKVIQEIFGKSIIK